MVLQMWSLPKYINSISFYVEWDCSLLSTDIKPSTGDHIQFNYLPLGPDDSSYQKATKEDIKNKYHKL